LKQKNLPVLDITGFFFRIRTQVTALVLRTSAFTWVLVRKKKPVMHLVLHLSTRAEKETRYIQYGPLLLFQ
jgi:hypothetical protein